MHQFIRVSFGNDIPFGINKKIADWAPLCCAVIPNVVRLSKDKWAFGETHLEKLCHSGMFIARAMFFGQLFVFGYIAVHDFMRR